MPFNVSIARGLQDVSEYHGIKFKQLIYSHLSYLRDFYKNQLITASAHQGLIWRGDLHGLLRALGISHNLFWVVSTMNGFDDPCDYDGTVLSFIVPTERDILLLQSRDVSINSEVR